MSKLLPLCAVIRVGLRRLVAYNDESMLFSWWKGKLEPYFIRDEQTCKCSSLLLMPRWCFNIGNYFQVSSNYDVAFLFPGINMVYEFIYMYASKLFSLN